MTGRLVLVTGGARSGKSRFALERAGRDGEPVLFVASGVATDDEMAARIARHRTERPAHWRTLEARYDLADRIRAVRRAEIRVVVEDLATTVSNLLVERQADEALVRREVEALVELAEQLGVELLVVSNEVGLGLVPTSSLGRTFRDLLGLANQIVAAEADEVVLLVAGLPLRLKG